MRTPKIKMMTRSTKKPERFAFLRAYAHAFQSDLIRVLRVSKNQGLAGGQRTDRSGSLHAAAAAPPLLCGGQQPS